MKVTITKCTTNPLTSIGGIAAYCYGMEDKKNRFKKIAERCLEEGHGRVSEFADIEMEIDGYSAKVIRELYTHIIGTSRLQASTRYIDYTKQFGYVTPHTIKSNDEANAIWEKAMNSTFEAMVSLKDIGIKTEDFTNLLPLAYETKMVLKINLRALIHMFNVRSCSCAYHEFRTLMANIRREIQLLGDEEWSFLCNEYFAPKCIPAGYCDEETRCCGIREKKSVVMKKIGLLKDMTIEEIQNKII